MIKTMAFISPLYKPIRLQTTTQRRCRIELIKRHEEIRRIICFGPGSPSAEHITELNDCVAAAELNLT